MTNFATVLLVTLFTVFLSPLAPIENGCSVTVDNIRPARLRDGHYVTVDARTAVASGGSLLMIGNSGISWAQATDIVKEDKFLLGVVLRPDGSFVSVGLPSIKAIHPRATSDGRNGWHVLYVEQTKAPRGGLPIDSASLWYAHFDGYTWSRQQKIANVFDAVLSSDFASSMEAIGSELYFAYNFDRSLKTQSNALGNQGVVMVRFRPRGTNAGKSKLDTLYLSQTPRYTQLVVRDDQQSASVYIAFSYLKDNRSWPVALFETVFTNTWAKPRVVFSDSINGIMAPLVTKLENGLVATWKMKNAAESDPTVVDLRANTVENTGRSQTISRIRQFDNYAVLALTARETVWIVRDVNSHRLLHLYQGIGKTIVPIGLAQVPMDNFTPLAVRLSDSTLFVISGKQGATAKDTPFVTVVSHLTISCK